LVKKLKLKNTTDLPTAVCKNGGFWA